MSHAAPGRLLIANRGEIVGRIAKSARRLGYTVIAVYSDADAGAMHVRTADEAYRLGPAPAGESYLDQDRIIEVAHAVRADALHPGYGFLSENASFAERCVGAGIVFVGPPAAAMRAMGSKSAAKTAMARAGVPVAPGYHESDQTAERLLAEALRVGFPLIVKASAGGGGKGMHVVQSAADLAAAVASAKRLARTAFGDDRLLLERYFPKARHIEVQIFADAHGATTALFDRDCSVQRRHQKIIEEAPAPGLEPKVRAAMAEAAFTVARTVGYVGAGTVEFLVDPEQRFYFMEMNTRLQVEHPVTEEITGLDLVEWQLRVARGERLPAAMGAGAVAGMGAPGGSGAPHGAAIEARLYAEDPARDYLPSAGRIRHLRWPAQREHLRLDVGVAEGDEVPPYYDPMLGKIIAWGASRREAIERLRRALGELEIAGITTNRALLASVLGDARFLEGAVETDFLTLRRAELAFGEPAAEETDLLLAALWYASRAAGPGALWADTTGWRLGAPALTRWRFAEQTVVLESLGEGAFRASLDGREQALRLVAARADGLETEIGGSIERVHIVVLDEELHLFRAGRSVRLRATHTEDALKATGAEGTGSLLTPLPGTVVAVHVQVGEQVAAGAPLVTVEAMKMEHTVSAPRGGIVERLPFAVGDRVTAGAALVELATPPRV